MITETFVNQRVQREMDFRFCYSGDNMYNDTKFAYCNASEETETDLELNLIFHSRKKNAYDDTPKAVTEREVDYRVEVALFLFLLRYFLNEHF